MYQHHDWQGALLDVSANKVVCVGSTVIMPNMCKK